MIWQKLVSNMVKPLIGSAPNATSSLRVLASSTSSPRHLLTSPQYAHAVRGRMLSLQAGLPKLPVPALSQTLNRFLETVKPLYSDEDYKRTEQLVSEFGKPGGSGEKLQTLLMQRANDPAIANWLSEYWLNKAYLEVRTPCPIYVNPGILLLDQNINGVDDQIKYAATLTAGVLDYKRMVDDQSLPVQYMGKQPLCMDQYFKILNACRIPGLKRDKFVVFPPDSENPPKHICVIRNNHIFSVRVYGDNGQVLSRNQLEEQFKQVLEKSHTTGPPMGVLTADARHNWGKTYARMCKDKHNKALFEEIHRSIFVLCLDKPVGGSEAEKHTTMANQMNHGGGSHANSCNRWFDKTIQFIVGPDGAVGVNYEHCSAEGPPILAIIDHAMNYVQERVPSGDDAQGVTEPQKLRFNLDSQIDDDFDLAASSFDATIGDLDMIAHHFDGYGKEFAKSQKLSPDALIQVSIQLAYRRLHNRNAPTYESGSLRKFQEGRTDTIRSCSIASDAYCRAMLSSRSTAQEKADALRKAVASHRNYTNQVVDGQGIDRHLMGLKLTAIENGLDVPPFLMDPAYTESVHFRLSTSQVPSKHNALLTFGPVVPEGYGICYNPMPHQINFAVSAWRSCVETDAQHLLNCLVQSLLDARTVLLETSAKL